MRNLLDFFDMPLPFLLTWFFCLGASIGSFLNVCILRLPDNESVAGSSSHCRSCGAKIRWYHNLPILGWLILRGRCASCGQRFSVRYLIVELFTGCAFAGLYWWEAGQRGLYPPALAMPPAWQGPTQDQIILLQYLVHIILLSLLIVASVIDLDYKWIPDEVTVPGTFIAFGFAAAAPWSLLPTWGTAPPPLPPFLRYGGFLPLTNRHEDWPPWLNGQTEVLSLGIALACYGFWAFALSWDWTPRRGIVIALRLALRRMARFAWRWPLLAGFPLIAAGWLWLPQYHWSGLLTSLVGLAFGCGLVWLVRVLSGLAMGEEALGFGDVVLVSMLGAYLGWQPIIFVFFLAPFYGLLLTGYYYYVHGEIAIPYGPSLCIAAATVVVRWYPFWDRTQGVFQVLGLMLPAFLIATTVVIVPLLILVRAVKRVSGLERDDVEEEDGLAGAAAEGLASLAVAAGDPCGKSNAGEGTTETQRRREDEHGGEESSDTKDQIAGSKDQASDASNEAPRTNGQTPETSDETPKAKDPSDP